MSELARSVRCAALLRRQVLAGMHYRALTNEQCTAVRCFNLILGKEALALVNSAATCCGRGYCDSQMRAEASVIISSPALWLVVRVHAACMHAPTYVGWPFNCGASDASTSNISQ